MIIWKLDDLLRRRRIKGRHLALAMGIGENYLSRVRHEVPDRLSLSLLDGLCRELDCTIADLLEYVPGEPHPAPAPVAVAAPIKPVASVSPAPPVAEAAPAADAPAAPPRPPLPLMAPLNTPTPAPAPEPSPDTAQGAAYVKGGALQAKLARLRGRRD